MPTQTFWNLPAAKREALVAIALEEFADNDYGAASVSRIVAAAGIAKGSLYQYFSDKRELFLFLVDHAGQALMGVVATEAPGGAPGGFFTTLRRQMSATTRAALALPAHARLLRRAYAAGHPLEAELARQGRAASAGHLLELVRQGVAAGELDAELDAELAAGLLAALLGGIGPLVVTRLGLSAEQAVAGDPAIFERPEVEAIYDAALRLVQHGMGARGGEL